MSKEKSQLSGKVLSVVLVWISFAILYTLLRGGNDTMIWLGLGLMAVTNVFMALKN